MQRIYYASGSILTGTAIAEAVLGYAEALAKSPMADTIRIPVVQESSGEIGTATLLVGPASQLMFVAEDAAHLTEPVDSALVDELEHRALLLGSPRPVPQVAEESALASEEYE